MNTVSSSEFDSIINDAVRGFVQSHRHPAPAAATTISTAKAVRLPITVRRDTDLAQLVRCFKLLCASDALREQFLRGEIVLDLALANAPAQAPVRTPEPAPAAGNAAPVQTTAAGSACRLPLALDESVVTEAVLRRSHAAGQVVILKPRAVITPAAHDYAGTAGIRMERSST